MMRKTKEYVMLVFLKLRNGVIEVWEHFFSGIPKREKVYNLDKILLPNDLPEAIAMMKRVSNGEIRSGIIQNIDALQVKKPISNVIHIDFKNKRKVG